MELLMELVEEIWQSHMSRKEKIMKNNMLKHITLWLLIAVMAGLSFAILFTHHDTSVVASMLTGNGVFGILAVGLMTIKPTEKE